MYIERTHYYAKPGCVEAVRRNRHRASAVRVKLGLQYGTIFYKADPSEDGPDVTWEGRFATAEERDRDLAARAASPEFESVRKFMRTQIAKFERHFQEVAPPSTEDAP